MSLEIHHRRNVEEEIVKMVDTDEENSFREISTPSKDPQDIINVSLEASRKQSFTPGAVYHNENTTDYGWRRTPFSKEESKDNFAELLPFESLGLSFIKTPAYSLESYEKSRRLINEESSLSIESKNYDDRYLHHSPLNIADVAISSSVTPLRQFVFANHLKSEENSKHVLNLDNIFPDSVSADDNHLNKIYKRESTDFLHDHHIASEKIESKLVQTKKWNRFQYEFDDVNVRPLGSYDNEANSKGFNNSEESFIAPLRDRTYINDIRNVEDIISRQRHFLDHTQGQAPSAVFSNVRPTKYTSSVPPPPPPPQQQQQQPHYHYNYHHHQQQQQQQYVQQHHNQHYSRPQTHEIYSQPPPPPPPQQQLPNNVHFRPSLATSLSSHLQSFQAPSFAYQPGNNREEYQNIHHSNIGHHSIKQSGFEESQNVAYGPSTRGQFHARQDDDVSILANPHSQSYNHVQQQQQQQQQQQRYQHQNYPQNVNASNYKQSFYQSSYSVGSNTNSAMTSVTTSMESSSSWSSLSDINKGTMEAVSLPIDGLGQGHMSHGKNFHISTISHGAHTGNRDEVGITLTKPLPMFSSKTSSSDNSSAGHSPYITGSNVNTTLPEVGNFTLPQSVGGPTNASFINGSVSATQGTSGNILDVNAHKNIYKNFSKTFKSKEETSSLEDAVSYAIDESNTITDKLKWKIYIDIADLYKRYSNYVEAKKYYCKLCAEFPDIIQGWLEYAKMEEENGNVHLSIQILTEGNLHCPDNEILLTKLIKQHEKTLNINGARNILSNLSHENIDKIWRTMLEGALLEGRAGNIDISRKIFKLLMYKISWYGPIYLEAYKMELNHSNFANSLQIIKKGLQELPRYGPLWFGYLNVTEMIEVSGEQKNWLIGTGLPKLTQLRKVSQSAISSISRELVWKVHFEQALFEEKALHLLSFGQQYSSNGSTSIMSHKRHLFATVATYLLRALMCCPSNLRWKIYLASARLELTVENYDNIYALLYKAKLETPEKSLYYIYLESSRIEEFRFNISTARMILSKARSEIKNEWKIYLETVLQEARCGNICGAIYIADKALNVFPGSGRLWALLIQFIHYFECKNSISKEFRKNKSSYNVTYDIPFALQSELIPPMDYVTPTKFNILYKAIQEVPKSGEVWCEATRIRLNPFLLNTFSLFIAQKQLTFAIQFTPQYGDSFVEYIRIEILLQILLLFVLKKLMIPLHVFLKHVKDGDVESDFYEQIKLLLQTQHISDGNAQVSSMHPPLSSFANNISNDAKLRKERLRQIQMCLNGDVDLRSTINANDYKKTVLNALRRRCVNADPNYGSAWFYLRQRNNDNVNIIFDSAFNIIIHEIMHTQHVYIRAITQYIGNVLNASSLQENVPSFYEGLINNFEKANEYTASTVSPFDIQEWTRDYKHCLSKENTFMTEIFHQLMENEIDVKKKDHIHVHMSCLPIHWNMKENICLSAQDFVTGVISMNQSYYHTYDMVHADDRRRALFGSDQIIL